MSYMTMVNWAEEDVKFVVVPPDSVREVAGSSEECDNNQSDK